MRCTYHEYFLPKTLDYVILRNGSKRLHYSATFLYNYIGENQTCLGYIAIVFVIYLDKPVMRNLLRAKFQKERSLVTINNMNPYHL